MSCLRQYLLNLVFIVQATLLITVTVSHQVHFITYLTAVNSRFQCSSLRSAVSRGIVLTVFGLKDGETEIMGPLSSNPSRLLRHFKELETNRFLDDDIIIFNDGSNVLYRGTAIDVERAYLKVEHVDTVLFSAEKACWPGTGGCVEPHSSITSSFKYAKNSGFIARYKTLIKFLEAWLKVIESKPFGNDDEQLALHQYMLGKGDLNNRVQVEVDYNCTIFQTTTDTHFDTLQWSTPDPKGPYMRTEDAVIFNSETNTEPLLYHFNNLNIHMLEADKLMWASQLEERYSSPDYKNTCIELLRRYPEIDYCKSDTSVVRSMRFNCGDTSKRSKVREKFVRRTNSTGDWIWFPGHIVPFHIRTDVTTGLAVTRGRVNLLKENKKYKYADYNRILQCPAGQPELYGKGGALNLANYIPLTQETLMLVSAYLESECGLWNNCRPLVDKYMDKGYTKNIDSIYGLSGQTNAKMFRIVNGSLYYDWPWGRERFDGNIQEDESLNYKISIMDVLKQVSDIPDSVFFTGGELVGLPSNIPVPFLSSSPKGSTSSDIPGVWSTAFNNERSRCKSGNYKSVTDEYNEYMLKKAGNSSKVAKSLDPVLRHNNIPGTWAARMDKAAFFGSMTDSGLHSHSIARQVVMNIASDYPDDLEANYSVCFQLTDINPGSSEPTNCNLDNAEWALSYSRGNSTEPFGYADKSLRRHFTTGVPLNKYMLSYRYLVVIGGVGSADRLNTFLAHSGAVILLQETDFLYHYSAFLRPWVHYVPLAFNAADLLEKILWLKAHPRLAERLATNAYNFGASYLRLEDYYCYTAAFLDAVSRIAAPSALMPFDMKKVNFTDL